MAISCLLGFLPISNDFYWPYSTPQLAWYFDFVTITTCLTHSRYCTVCTQCTGCICQSARTGQLWTGAHGIPSLERFGVTISESTCSGIKLARLSPSAVIIHAAAAHHAVPSVNNRPSLILHFSGTLPDDVQSCSLHCLPLPVDNS